MRVGPTVSQPREQNQSQQKQEQNSGFKAILVFFLVNELSSDRDKRLTYTAPVLNRTEKVTSRKARVVGKWRFQFDYF